MTDRLSILMLCGGYQSTEHQISVLSARNVMQMLDVKKYAVSVVYITINGRWLYFQDVPTFLNQKITHLADSYDGEWMHIVPGDQNPFQLAEKAIKVDCVLPILHGTHGEDGAIQGLLNLLHVPYAGPDVLAAAVAMHKDVAKRLLRQAGLSIVDWITIRKHEKNRFQYTDITRALGETVFVKPNSLGSSVGISKATDENSFYRALDFALQFDDHVLVERAMTGSREIECSVLGNEKPVASLPGEIINHTEFYSYTAKYMDDHAATVQTPADLSDAVVTQVRKLSVQVFEVLRCVGMARVDFFLTPDEKLIINEVNTVPGFTDISMYPKNWEVSGLSQEALIDKLIQLALVRFEEQNALIRQYPADHSNKNKQHFSVQA